MKYLVPIDFTSSAENAGRYAANLAKATGSSILFLHVIAPFVDENSFLTADLTAVTIAAKDQLNHYVQTIADDNKITARGIVVKGDVIEEILKTARQKEISMIIMGTHTVGPLMKFIFGSTTTSIIEKSALSVLAVPETVSYCNPHNIVYASDYENSDIESLKDLATMAEFFDAEINVVHIASNYDQPITELSIIDYFSDLVKKNIGYPKIVCRVFKSENIAKGIEIFANTVGADMIALSTRKRSPLGKLLNSSLTKEFVYQSKLPIIAFHQFELELSDEF